MLPRWLVLSALSAVFYGLSNVASYQMVNKYKMSSSSSLAITDLFAALTFLVVMSLPSSLNGERGSGIREIIQSSLGAALVVALLFGVGDYVLNMSYAISPNPGYCDSISDSEMIITALLSLLVFKAPVSSTQLVGMVIAVFSLYFLQSG